MHNTRKLEEILQNTLDDDNNTVVHFAAESGYSSIFKVKCNTPISYIPLFHEICSEFTSKLFCSLLEYFPSGECV